MARQHWWEPGHAGVIGGWDISVIKHRRGKNTTCLPGM